MTAPATPDLQKRQELRRLLLQESKRDELRRMIAQGSAVEPPIESITETAISAQPAGQQQFFPQPPVFDPSSERAIEAQPVTPPEVTRIEGELPGPMKKVADIARTPEVQRVLAEAATGTAAALGANKLAGVAKLGTVGTNVARSVGAGLGEGVASLSMEEVDPSEDPISRAIWTAVIGATAEGVAGGFIDGMNIVRGKGSVGGGGFGPVAGAEDLIEAAAKHDLVPTPGTSSDAYWVDFFENVLSNAPASAGTMKAARENVQKAMLADLDEVLFAIGKVHGRDAVTMAGLDAINNGIDLWKTHGAVLYKRVDDIAGGTRPDIYNVVPEAERILRDSKVVANSSQRNVAESILLVKDEVTMDPILHEGKRVFRTSDPGKLRVGSELVDAAELGLSHDVYTLTFRDAHLLRSKLLQIGRTADEPIAGAAEASAKQLIPLMTDSMNKAARDLSPEAQLEFRRARAFYKAGHKKYNNDLVKKVLNSDEDRFADLVIRPNSPNRVIKMRNAMGPEKWDDVVGDHMMNALVQSDRQGQGVLDYIHKTLGEDTWVAMIPNERKRKGIEKTLELVASAQRKTSVDVGGGFMGQISAAGAIFTLIRETLKLQPFSQQSVAAATILIAPGAMARLGVTPGFHRWLTVGLKAPRGSKKAATAFAAINAMAAREQHRYERRKAKENLEKRTIELRDRRNQRSQRIKEQVGPRPFQRPDATAGRTSVP